MENEAEQERREAMGRYTAGLTTEELRALAHIMGRLVETMSAESS